MDRILCAIDRSEPSLRAAQVAAELAGKCKAELVLLSVIPVLDVAQRDINEYLRHEHEAATPAVVLEDAAYGELRRLGDRIASQSEVATTCEVRCGDAAAEIVTSAKDHGSDLVVVGHRGQNRLTQLLLGSVAKKVLETAPCPVLVVH
jgi:nucleotide-binding universal stress UspA family protein